MVTLQPPTYEIFTMVARVALISVGHLMYCGRRRNMLPYFSSADYACPAFKNPSDYYRKLKLKLIVNVYLTLTKSKVKEANDVQDL